MGSIQSIPEPPPQTTNGFIIISQGAVPEETILQKDGRLYTFKKINNYDPYSNYYIVGINNYENGFKSHTNTESINKQNERTSKSVRTSFLARDAGSQFRQASGPKAPWTDNKSRQKPGNSCQANRNNARGTRRYEPLGVL